MSAHRGAEHIATLRSLASAAASPAPRADQRPPLPVLSLSIICAAGGNLAYNVPFFKAFSVAVCNGCTAVHAAEYRLITKSTAASSYLLSESDLQPLSFLLKPNPSRGSFANMKLYRERDVLQAVQKRWGGEEGVKEERERREKDRMAREVQKRRKGRLAAEKERKVREYRVDRIDSSKGHKHKFVDLKPQGKQRCSECGFTLEYEEL
jgi:DNA repair protein